jgi:hypothetical protein
MSARDVVRPAATITRRPLRSDRATDGERRWEMTRRAFADTRLGFVPTIG